MATYATEAELTTYTGAAAPADAARLLEHASELIDEVTLGRSVAAWVDPLPEPLTTAQVALRRATCAQVEFWSSFGEEHDIEGVRGAMSVGVVRIDQLPQTLGIRAARALRRGGLLSALVRTTGSLVFDARELV